MRTRHLLHAACFCLLVSIAIPGILFAQEEPDTDSTRTDSLWTSWDHRTLAIDSALVTHDFARGWIFPAALIIATGTAVFLLFSTRSR